jgi:chromosome segregation protein
MQTAQQQLTRLEAQRHALEQLQAKLGSDEKLKSWLARHGLDTLPRLWQGLTVEPGWEDAVESVLRERLNAVQLGSLSNAESWLNEAAPARFAVFENDGRDEQESTLAAGLTPLRRLISWQEGAAPACMADWLAGVYYAESAAEAMNLRARLPAGAALVCREGHLFTRSSLTFYAPQSELHGVLARQREIEALLVEHSRQMEELERQKEALRMAEEALQRNQAQVNQLRASANDLRQRQHSLQMETLKLAQLVERVSQRGEQIQHELAEIGEQIEAENRQKAASEANLGIQQEQIDDLKEHLQDARQERATADQFLNGRRASLQTAERAAQEAVFYEKTCNIKIA